jgi:pyruvate,water dikinase
MATPEKSRCSKVIRPFSTAEDENRFGGKAISLGRAVRAGLPVPPGFALSVDFVEAVVAGDPDVLDPLEEAFGALGTHVAVRSSAVGEDAKDASFAGQHVTILNVGSTEALISAIRAVHQSAHSASALSYRQRLGVEGTPQIAVAVQQLVDPESAGVLFTRNPVTGARERVIEAAWGLGEVVVSGLVVPDSYRISPEGQVLERSVGEKDIELRSKPDGGTEEVPVDPSRIRSRVLDDGQLEALHQLVIRCEDAYGPELDVEWAFATKELFLLQCRSITRIQS